MSKGARRQAEWTYSTLALALAALLNGTGCLRFAYNEVDRRTGATRDAGMDASANENLVDASSQMDSQPPAAGRSGTGGTGHSGSAGTGGRSGAGTNGGSGSIADAAVDVGDAGASDASLPSDAGPMDAAGSGGGGGSGGAGSGATRFDSCASATGVVFCDGFEEAMPWVPYKPWSYELLTHGSEARSTNTKYAGTAALHMSTTDDATGTRARIASEDLNGKMTGDAWLRYYYYIPSSVTISTYFSSGVMSEVESPYNGFSLLIHTSSLSIESMSVKGTATFTFPRDRWVCVEMHVSIDPSSGTFEIYTDGVRRITTLGGNTLPATGWTAAEVGIHYVGSGQGPVDVYVDNVVVSTARYGCD